MTACEDGDDAVILMKNPSGRVIAFDKVKCSGDLATRSHRSRDARRLRPP